MAKVAKATEVRTGQRIKAGKKKLNQEPPPPNPAKKAAREAGLQQFRSPVQLTVPGTKIVFDKGIQQFVTKTVSVSVPFLYDQNRKHFVYSPRDDKDE